ncbi:MAG: hypothetical protein ABI968_09055, partial [Acidobacteriota bacterium]
LSDDVPAEAEAQRHHFEPDLSNVRKKDLKFYTEKASLLKRLLVYRSPIMPTGLLGFCLEYAAKDTKPLAGVFSSIRKGFANLSATTLKSILDRVYNFRNTYVAHEKEDLLADATQAREGLSVWVTALVGLFRAQHQEVISASEGSEIALLHVAEPRGGYGTTKGAE